VRPDPERPPEPVVSAPPGLRLWRVSSDCAQFIALCDALAALRSKVESLGETQ